MQTGEKSERAVKYQTEYQNEVLETMLPRSTTLSLPSPYMVFSQVFLICFLHSLGAWKRLYVIIQCMSMFLLIHFIQKNKCSLKFSMWISGNL